MSDFARWTVAAEMMVLLLSLVAVVALEPAAARRSPRAWWWALVSVVIVIFGVTIAVILNALVAGPQTPGVKALAYIAGPAAGAGVVGVVVAVRRRPRTLADHRAAQVIANAPQIAEALSHLQHLEPCPTPDCQLVRYELTKLIGGPTQPPPA